MLLRDAAMPVPRSACGGPLTAWLVRIEGVGTQKTRLRVDFRVGTLWARNFDPKTGCQSKCPLSWTFPVVGTGVDPVTSRFSDRNRWQRPTGQECVAPPELLGAEVEPLVPALAPRTTL